MTSKTTFDSPENYYEFLGLTPEASQEEIRKAYIQLARKYHPDHNNNQEDRRMIELNLIFDILSHPDKKREYDARFKPATEYDFTTKSKEEEKEKNKETTPVNREQPYVSRNISRNKPVMKNVEIALIVLLISLMCYIAFYLVVKILEINMTLPDWIDKLVPV